MHANSKDFHLRKKSQIPFLPPPPVSTSSVIRIQLPASVQIRWEWCWWSILSISEWPLCHCPQALAAHMATQNRNTCPGRDYQCGAFSWPCPSGSQHPRTLSSAVGCGRENRLSDVQTSAGKVRLLIYCLVETDSLQRGLL